MEILTVTNLGYGYAEKKLYEKSSFKLMDTDHVGVVGVNGSGKSTLLKLLIGNLTPDEGQVAWSTKASIGYIDQHMKVSPLTTFDDFLRSVYHLLYEKEKKMLGLYEKYSKTGKEDLLQVAANLQEELDAENFYAIDHHIERVTRGLGLSKISLEMNFIQLSQGQKMKMILAKILLENPSVLILDEPTNYLDEEDVKWLTTYLQQSSQAFIVVSHDLPFLDSISTCLLDVSFERIEKYQMSYREFLKLKELRQQSYQSEYESQQKKIKKTEAFIQKNIAGVNTKMAQGRRKQLERMERLREPEKSVSPQINFKALSTQAKVLVSLKDVAVGYEQALIEQINLSIEKEDKLAIKGEQLIGKTTLLKTILKMIPQLKGQLVYHPKTVIGYFSQELIWEDMTKTPIEILANKHSQLTYEIMRRELSKFGIHDKLAERPIETLSGGEQSRVKLCDLSMNSYTILVFDEPTKHLDKTSKTSLQKAIKSFRGSVVIVSQDKKFFKDLVNKIMSIEDGKLRISHN